MNANGIAPREAFAQRLSAAGSPVGSDDFRVSTHPETDLHLATDVVADPRTREWVVSWVDCFHDHNGTEGTFARRVVAR
jgi:hypothetical protein